jgi:hypothetical protein
VLEIVVPTLVPVPTVLVPVLALTTVPVIVLCPASVPELVPIGVPMLTVFVGVVEAIEFVRASGFAVVVPWLLVLPTWPVFSFGLAGVLDVPEFACASLGLVV